MKQTMQTEHLEGDFWNYDLGIEEKGITTLAK